MNHSNSETVTVKSIPKTELEYLLAEYERVTKELNVVVEAERSSLAARRNEGGSRTIPLEATRLINARGELSHAICERLVGVSFVGWGKG